MFTLSISLTACFFNHQIQLNPFAAEDSLSQSKKISPSPRCSTVTITLLLHSINQVQVFFVFVFFDSTPPLEVMHDHQRQTLLNIGACYSYPCDVFTVRVGLRCLFWIYAGCLRGGTTGAERKISQRSASPSFSGAAVYLAGSKERRRLGRQPVK